MDPARSLEQRLDELERLVRQLVVRVTELELARAAPSARPTAPGAGPPPPGAPREPVAVAPEHAAPARSFEDVLGGRILAWVGGLAIVVGVVFFLAIAVDRGWIGVEARVALAFLGSTVLLAVGVFLHEWQGRTEAAVAAVASALAALYATLTYATAVEGVAGEEAGLLVAAIVGLAGSAVAVRWGSQLVAALAVLGALAAPVLVDAGTTGLALAFMAVALVAAVAVLLWQRWGWLALGALITSARPSS